MSRCRTHDHGPEATMRLRERARLGVPEQPLDLLVERPDVVDELACDFARALEQRAIGAQAREAEVGQTCLPRPEELALAPDLEVLLGQLEAVGRRDERLEPLFRS